MGYLSLIACIFYISFISCLAKTLHVKNEEKKLISPYNGTDISDSSIINCHNQTSCIKPQLQLSKIFNVYFCKAIPPNSKIRYGIRFYYLIEEGLMRHPKINLVKRKDEAEVIVYLPFSSYWEFSECNDLKDKNKTIVLDEEDKASRLFNRTTNVTTGLRSDSDWLGYFKRSYTHRPSGKSIGYMPYLSNPEVHPLTYTIADNYVRNYYNNYDNRTHAFVCTLRGSPKDTTRLRVKQWSAQYGSSRGLSNYVAGEINRSNRDKVDSDYFSLLYNAKIIVTTNPTGYEGDYRLMESFASGALIFVDKMLVPRPNPFIDKVHVVYYDNYNKSDLFSKLDYYRQHPEIAKKIAISGYLHAMKYHRTSTLIDYVFRTVHGKLDPTQKYFNTGYDMRLAAINNAKLKIPESF